MGHDALDQHQPPFSSSKLSCAVSLSNLMPNALERKVSSRLTKGRTEKQWEKVFVVRDKEQWPRLRGQRWQRRQRTLSGRRDTVWWTRNEEVIVWERCCGGGSEDFVEVGNRVQGEKIPSWTWLPTSNSFPLSPSKRRFPFDGLLLPWVPSLIPPAMMNYWFRVWHQLKSTERGVDAMCGIWSHEPMTIRTPRVPGADLRFSNEHVMGGRLIPRRQAGCSCSGGKSNTFPEIEIPPTK